MVELSEGAVAGHVRAVAEQGYSVIEDAIPPALVVELRAAIDGLEERRGLGYGETRFEGRRTLRVYNLLAHDPAFAKVPIHPPTLAVAEGVMDPGLLLSSLSAIVIGPGEQAQPLHGDSQMIPLPRPHPPIAVN
ncbi:MAG: phytanoyl-CoA dioxygenase, partial [Alphaproteobacteria bacterium]|nr:phytanoyl-CoA dioxygenase [Alphaproteobacteria bacterium]